MICTDTNNYIVHTYMHKYVDVDAFPRTKTKMSVCPSMYDFKWFGYIVCVCACMCL